VRIPSAQDLVASEREAEERRQRAAASLCGGGSAGGGSGLFAFLVRAEEGPRLTACLIVLWAALSFAYYGIVFALPTWFERHIPPEWEYWATFFTAAAEVPGNWVGGEVADRYGRKLGMILGFALSSIFACGCALLADRVDADALSWQWLLACACLLKMAICIAFTVVYLYTAEAFPTRIRNFALSSCTVVTRVGGAITPTVAQVLLDQTTGTATFVTYGAACVIGTVAAFSVPFETRGRDADVAEQAGAPSRPRPNERSPLVQTA